MRCVLAAADELHFTRAAEKLHITHSALTRQIRHLELQLGVDLFIRAANSSRRWVWSKWNTGVWRYERLKTSKQ